MNSSSAQKTFMRMQNIVLKNSQAQCFLVEVIAKKSQNEAWKVSLDGNLVSDNRIRKVSIDKFYELVTGDKLAFQKLCKSLPKILDDVLKESSSAQPLNTVLNEFKEISSNLEKSIYLLAFNKYEGFGDF
jgi:Eco47II restriction endonuclease